MPPVIVARALYKCYAGFAPVLRGVNIQVEPGEVAAIMGPSGCGKSTMLHILGMLHAPDAGSLEILGSNVLTFDREQTAAFRRANMGFVMQSSNLFEHSTVFENVEFPLIYDNIPPQERWERVIHALELVRLSARVHYRSNRLSGGEQQRVAIARAMVNNPRILLADEPTGALDARTSRLIMDNFRTLCHSGGVSMIMVTHDPKMAEFCDSVYTLDDGILNCKKHGTGPYTAKEIKNLLAPPEPLVRGALVAGRFPAANDPQSLALAESMNARRLLSRIYSIFPSAFLGDPEGYALPLAVRHIGRLQRISSLLAFFRGARGSQSLWKLWRRLPGHEHPGHGLMRQIRAFSYGARLAQWGIGDNIEYLHAAGAGEEATAAWVAASMLRRPFGFTVESGNMAGFGHDLIFKARDAALVTCSTIAIRNEFCRLVPDLAPEKVILLRPGLLDVPPEEDADKKLPPQQGKPVVILTAGAVAEQLHTIISACSALKRLNIQFRLVICGAHGWRLRLFAWRRGLRRLVSFRDDPRQDSAGELYRNADIYVAAQSASASLELPEPVCMAMAYGLGIAVSGMTPGLGEALSADNNCLLSPAGDVAALAANLQKLANDSSLRSKLGNAARTDINALLNDSTDSMRMADLVVQAAALGDRAHEIHVETNQAAQG